MQLERLERQTSEQRGNDEVESDCRPDEYNADSDRELQPVSDHDDESIIIYPHRKISL